MAGNLLSTDFDHLRAEGIRHIQRLAGQRWTDYNTHDPGITVLEVLCYALTDLAYRTGYSIPDLLGKEGLAHLRAQYGPDQLLPGAPVSEQDLRRLMLHSSDASGARLEPVTDANPRLYYHPYDQAIGISPVEGAVEMVPQGLFRAFTGSGAEKIRPALLANRPLCVDWYEVKDMGADLITVQADLELAPDSAQPESIALLVFQALREAIAPTLHFQDRMEAQRQGIPADRVYEGPLLQQGYLSDTELDKLAQGNFLRASDLIQVLMDVPGIVAVKSILMGEKGERWLLPLTPGKYPKLDPNSKIALYRSSIREEFSYLGDNNAPPAASTPELAGQNSHKDRNTSYYHSIRYQLPAVYGLDAETLSEDPVQRARTRQTNAYLLLFEQILADYLAQLSQTRQLFDFDGVIQNTYAVQVLRHLPGALTLYGMSEGADEADFAQQLQVDLQHYVEPEPARRLNRLLDHLLARFAESFADYALLVSSKKELSEQLAQAKRDFLREYPAIGLRRGTGCDYSDPFSRSGLEHRIARLLGLPWPPKTLGQGNAEEDALALASMARGETFFLVEHILLRAVPKDTASGEDDYLLTGMDQADPYSRQLTFVFPNYSARFAPGEAWDAYWKLVLTTLRRETPAHLSFNCLQLDQVGFPSFATAHQSWRQALANVQGIDNNAFRVARDRVIDLLVERTPTVKFLLGWSRPILDLQIKVPVVAPGTRVPAILLDSQGGVVYTLCDWLGDPVKDETGKVITGFGAGYDIEILLPTLSKDTTFLLKAQKNLPGQALPSEGFLRQKLRVRVGIDTKIPVSVLDPEIDFNTGTRVRLDNTQAEVFYVLLNLQNAVISENPVEGDQGNSIELKTNNLAEDTTFRVQATRTFGNTPVVKMIDGNYAVRVRPNPGLATAANAVIVPYNTPATTKIDLPQASAKYQIFNRPIGDTEFTNTDLPATWTAANLTTALSGLNLSANTPIPASFGPSGAQATGNGNSLVLNTAALQEDIRFLVFAKKDGHGQGVILTKSTGGAVLVMPNPNVQAQIPAGPFNPGDTTTIQIIDPQPGVLYRLYKKGDQSKELGAVYYHNTQFNSPGEDGIESVRLEYDFFVGEPLSPPLQLITPPLGAATEFEIVAEKVQTGLKATLTAVLKVAIKQPGAPRNTAPPPSAKRKPPKKDKG